MKPWKIYFADGTTFSNTDGPPELSPGLGVICVLSYDEDQRRKISHAEHYYSFNFEIGRWFAHDACGLWQYLSSPGVKVVRFGTFAGELVYRSVMLAAQQDPEFPVERKQ